MACKLKKGMTVVVISGREKGKSGKILRIDRERNRAVVEGVNIIKRATRPNPKNPQGGIMEREAALHVSNLAGVDPDTKAPVRIGFAVVGGVKKRVARGSGKVVES